VLWGGNKINMELQQWEDWASHRNSCPDCLYINCRLNSGLFKHFPLIRHLHMTRRENEVLGPPGQRAIWGELASVLPTAKSVSISFRLDYGRCLRLGEEEVILLELKQMNNLMPRACRFDVGIYSPYTREWDNIKRMLNECMPQRNFNLKAARYPNMW